MHGVCLRLGHNLALMVAGLVIGSLTATSVFGEPSADGPETTSFGRVLPPGQLPGDGRLGPLKRHDGHFPFDPPADLDGWKQRRESVRRRVLVATGLWPMPERVTPNAVVHGPVERDGYVVERVYLESYPGHFVTGSLYRPTGSEGPFPAVLCPYGHWGEGRFQESDEKSIDSQIASGAECTRVGAKYPLQARCVHLARMGCIVLIYDMEGYADSQQISFEVAHGTRSPRPAFEGPTDWGFYSTQAELRLVGPLGLQLYNGLCALDWLASRPDVDASRIGITGSSGGATQTFMMAAIDPRPTAVFPVCMVSTAMQGGCTCENASALRVGTGNVELAALFAPKPLGMASANDWTHNLINDGYPQLEQLYRLYDAGENVSLASLVQYGHNYNHASRTRMCAWMNEHLRLGCETPVEEQEFEPLSIDELRVWDDRHPQPETTENYERELVRTMYGAAERAFAAFSPKDEESVARFEEVTREAFRLLLSCESLRTDEATFTEVGRTRREGHTEIRGLSCEPSQRSELPTVVLMPDDWNGQFVLWCHGEGKRSLYSGSGEPTSQILRLVKAGFAVASADVIFQGEFLHEGEVFDRSRTLDTPRPLPAYTYGYNPPVLGQRTADLLTLLSVVRRWGDGNAETHLLASEGSAPWALAARALATSEVSTALIDTAHFRFADLASWRDVDFLPGAVKYGDLPALIALNAPQPLCLAGEKGIVPEVAVAAYAAHGAGSLVTSRAGGDADQAMDLVDWFFEAHNISDEVKDAEW